MPTIPSKDRPEELFQYCCICGQPICVSRERSGGSGPEGSYYAHWGCAGGVRYQDLLAIVTPECKQAGADREISIGHPMYCPVCGMKILFDDPKFTYCDHVKFAYGWTSGDDDSFIHVQPSFARSYLAQLHRSDAYREYLDENGIKIGYDHLSRFVSGTFEPFDATAKLIPYFSECVPASITIFSCHWGKYSGAYLGIACGEGIKM